jgi:hypothetical protein
MDQKTLLLLLQARLDKTKFGLSGLDVYWIDPTWNTPENNAIVEEVVVNYTALAAFLISSGAAKDLVVRDCSALMGIKDSQYKKRVAKALNIKP